MDLRAYIEIVKRHKWLIVQATVAVALVAGLLTALRTPTYTATARVLLRPNDPSEQLQPTQSRQQVDPDRFASAQVDIAASRAVAKAAGAAIQVSDVETLLKHVSVHQSSQNDIIGISGKDIDAVHARDIANAFAHAYIDNRREFAVANLKQAADEIQTKLRDLQTRLGALDARIGDGGLQPGATAGVTGVTDPNASNAPQQSSQPDALNADLGGAATSKETLKAARYAAAVQYEQLFSQQQQIQVDISLKRGEAELIEEARTPTSPSSPGPKRNGLLGAFVGLLIGLGVAFLKEQLNDKVRTREEAQKLTDVPVIAELPAEAEGKDEDGGIPAFDRPSGAVAEAARSLRTSVGFLSLDVPIRKLVVTSPQPGDGKSFVAANLAVVYAQAGMRTVLVYADLRRPRVPAGLLRPGEGAQSVGFTGVLSQLADLAKDQAPNQIDRIPDTPAPRAVAWWEALSETTTSAVEVLTEEERRAALVARRRKIVESALVPTAVPNLAVLPSGATPPNPAELLGSTLSEELLGELAAMSDIVIIDTPPLMAVADPAILAEKSDGVLLVAALGETARDALTRGKTVLDNAKARVLGVVLNKVEPGRSSYYYGYYHQ